MRYYTIQINNDDGSSFATYTSFVGGQTDPGALQVELDIPVTTLANPQGAASIKIWGVSLQVVGQATNFNGKQLQLFAGMQKGLPLANPQQSGLILQGTIYQAFGNWIGVNQWVELIVVTNGAELGQQLNISFTWPKGAQLGPAIQNTLQTALPGYTIDVNVSSKLVAAEDDHGFYRSPLQFAQYVKDVSIPILGGSYSGVEMLIQEKAVKVFDGTSPTSPQQIAFTDLIGQPTWIYPSTIQVTTVMRADLQPTAYIKLPQTQIAIAPSDPLVGLKDSSVFQGAFLITQMRHVGNFRQPDATSWVTTMNCSPAAMAA